MSVYASIRELKEKARANVCSGTVRGRVENIADKSTRDSKPYREAVLADSEDRFTLRIWSDHRDFSSHFFERPGVCVELEGEFNMHPSFGLEAKSWNLRELNEDERALLLAGSEERRLWLASEEEYVRATAASIADPRLNRICFLFLDEFGERWRRTAAARNYHHARRGGLLEHTAQMMRSAEAISHVYPWLNRDLLIAGVLFHDSGKLWENAVEEEGFGMPYTEPGELLGHITIGVEMINRLWRGMMDSAEVDTWSALKPPSERVRLHLLHLVAAHHGSNEFGSPVDPKTPEAWVLHFVDNLDAKLEMISMGYHTAAPLAPRVLERVRPLPGNLVLPLERFEALAEDSTQTMAADLTGAPQGGDVGQPSGGDHTEDGGTGNG